MALTQFDLAKHAGLSRTSVARVLSGQRVVCEETRRRVMQAAQELGYDQHTNHHARALIARRYGKRLRQNAIAVLIPRDPKATVREMPFFTQLLDGIEWQANQYHLTEGLDVDLFLFSMLKPEVPRLFVGGGIDGAISVAPLTPELAARYTELDIPIISLVNKVEGVPHLGPENTRGMTLAVKHLADLGHERIAYVGPGPEPEYAAASERIAGYRRGLKQCRLPFDPALLEATVGALTYASGAVERLVRRTRDFTAIVCYNDLVAMRAVPVLEKAGLKVPLDVSIVGFDDISVQENFRLSLTSVHFDRFEIGKHAVQWICDQFDGEGGDQSGTRASTSRSQLFPVKVVVRDSTTPPAGTRARK